MYFRALIILLCAQMDSGLLRLIQFTTGRTVHSCRPTVWTRLRRWTTVVSTQYCQPKTTTWSTPDGRMTSSGILMWGYVHNPFHSMTLEWNFAIGNESHSTTKASPTRLLWPQHCGRDSRGIWEHGVSRKRRKKSTQQKFVTCKQHAYHIVCMLGD